MPLHTFWLAEPAVGLGDSQGGKILENACKGVFTFPSHVDILSHCTSPNHHFSSHHALPTLISLAFWQREKPRREVAKTLQVTQQPLARTSQLEPAFFCSAGVSKFHSLLPPTLVPSPPPSPAPYAKWLLLSHFPFPSRKSPLWSTDSLPSLNWEAYSFLRTGILIFPQPEA